MTEHPKKKQLAEVLMSCGRSALFVADIAVAVEGDRCRHLLPAEVAEQIPPEELARARIGDQRAKDLPLDVVRFFRGEPWTTKSLQWAADAINRAANLEGEDE